jgi:Animal haem peroxidase
MKRHTRDNYLVANEGIYSIDAAGKPQCTVPTAEADLRKFRFSRLGPKGEFIDGGLRALLATEMMNAGDQPDSSGPVIPAGYTYLGQFVDHDLTFDKTAVGLGDAITVEELKQGRSPALDLDSLYGRGPAKDGQFYADGIRLKIGASQASPQPVSDSVTTRDLENSDLPRVGLGATPAERMKANIPDFRNDENLAVAQTHLAFIRFHNRTVHKLATTGMSGGPLFDAARTEVVKHYQWMLRTDFLPRIVEPRIVDEVFSNGRKVFEVNPPSGSAPTMPIEFSVAAYRLGHSMIRGGYQWNRVFRQGGAVPASLALLFQFSGTSGSMLPGFERLPTNWVADFRRLYDFSALGKPDLLVEPGERNAAKRIDTVLVDPLKQLPLGSFGWQRSCGMPTRRLNRSIVRRLSRVAAKGWISPQSPRTNSSFY